MAITGTVAAGNALAEDDIDLFVIVPQKRLWLTRAVMLQYLSILGRRINISTEETGDLFCVNHILTDKNLTTEHQDIYIANEIARMQILWSRHNAQEKFLAANAWIRNYLPHTPKPAQKSTQRQWTQSLPTWLQSFWFIISAPLRTPVVLLSWIDDMLERGARYIQLRRLGKKQPQLADAERLTYHPHDNREWVLREYYTTE